jgi:hypothetical protein
MLTSFENGAQFFVTFYVRTLRMFVLKLDFVLDRTFIKFALKAKSLPESCYTWLSFSIT